MTDLTEHIPNGADDDIGVGEGDPVPSGDVDVLASVRERSKLCMHGRPDGLISWIREVLIPCQNRQWHGRQTSSGELGAHVSEQCWARVVLRPEAVETPGHSHAQFCQHPTAGTHPFARQPNHAP